MGFLIDWIFSGSYTEAQQIKLMKKIGRKVDELPIEEINNLLKKK